MYVYMCVYIYIYTHMIICMYTYCTGHLAAHAQDDEEPHGRKGGVWHGPHPDDPGAERQPPHRDHAPHDQGVYIYMSLSLYIYIYMYMHIVIYVIYIYIYIY